LTVNLPDNIRDGFYRARQEELRTLIKQAETTSGATVLSVMGDRNGTAYFTDLEPGAYVISSIFIRSGKHCSALELRCCG